MTSIHTRLRVLVVTDNPYVGGTLTSAIRKYLPDASVVRLTPTLSEATDWLRQERYQAVVVAQDLADGKGFALLKSLLMLPRKPVGLFLIGDARAGDTDLVRFLRENPEVTFIQKPFRYAAVGMKVRSALLPSQSTEQTYYGLRLSELIQAFSIARRNATIQIILPDNVYSAIYIQNGDLVHATCGDAEGAEAMARIIRSKKGDIRVDKGCATAKRTITHSTQRVLLDIYREIDEGDRGRGSPGSTLNALDSDLDNLINDVFDTT